MSDNMKTCPFCKKEILKLTKKCYYCGKWIEKNVTKRKISWSRILLCLIFMTLIVRMGIYENDAQNILSYSQKEQSIKNYQTATMGCQVVIEKFWMSFATLKAKENIYRIKSRIGFSPIKRLGKITFIETCIGWFNPYKHHGLPLITSLACGVILLFTFLLNLCFLRFMFFKLLLGMASIGLFGLQLIHYGIIKQPDFEKFAHTMMANSSMVFVWCYLFIILTMITILIPKKEKGKK